MLMKLIKYSSNDGPAMVTRCHATNPICQPEVESETNKYRT